MRTISGLFDTRDQADRAVDALEDAGIPSEDISIVGPDDDESGTAEGAGVGAVLGGAGGLLAGLGAFAIPGIGPVVGAGWLATTLIGAAAGGVAGGLLGSLTDAGVDEREAHVYAEGVRRGGTLVTARADEANADAAAAILGQSGRVDVSDRRAEYEAAGWRGYDPLGEPWPRTAADADPVIPVVPPVPR